MMGILVLIVIIWLAARVIPIMLVGMIATIIAITLAVSSRRNARALIASRARHVRAARWEDRPSRADRRLFARSIRTSIRQTIVRSLFPNIAARADDIVSAAERGLGFRL
ncbi:hypothetical protein SFC76_19495 [Sphingomonas sp. CD22]|uniref:hypothetical protein n=1 Tax=Sphingomonas sp. CD22 TaxID=3100214 RepID=UPI002ADF6AEB|nr:hypothetical protein [Sphingomonas sp. CD22]MEA1086462.1 hypothetical protein [Sphingomonas sp. CD22]